MLAVGGFYLRHLNKQEAARQAQALIAADQAGQDTTAPLQSLKDYIKGHMGAKADVTLSAGYERAQAAARVAAQAQAANSQIYAQAQAACAGKSDSITQAKCNQEYLSKHLTSVPPPAPVAEPKLADYQHNLRSPLWTADLAGALFVGVIAALALLLPGLRRRKQL